METMMTNNFEKENPGLIDALAEITSWNSFAASLVEQYNKRKTLSEKQTFAAVAMLAKIKQKQADRKSNMFSLDVSKILAVLD